MTSDAVHSLSVLYRSFYTHLLVMMCRQPFKWMLWQHSILSLSPCSGDPNATSLIAENLNISTYTFTVKAKTAVGECGTTSVLFTMNSPSRLLPFPSTMFSRVQIMSHWQNNWKYSCHTLVASFPLAPYLDYMSYVNSRWPGETCHHFLNRRFKCPFPRHSLLL